MSYTPSKKFGYNKVYLPVEPVLNVPTSTTSSLSLSWTMSDDLGITDYIVEYKKSTDTDWIIFNDGVSVTKSATITNVLASTTYNVRVKAVNTFGVSGYSNIRNITTAIAIPTIGLMNVVDTNNIYVPWTISNEDTITDYIVEYKKSTDTDWIIFNDGTSLNKFTTITNLLTDVIYNIRIKANSTLGTSAYSSIATIDMYISAITTDPLQARQSFAVYHIDNPQNTTSIYTSTFTVDTTNDEIIPASDISPPFLPSLYPSKLVDGAIPIRFTTTGTLPTPLQLNTDYYLSQTTSGKYHIYPVANDNDVPNLYTALPGENILAGQNYFQRLNKINLTNNGTGTHTLSTNKTLSNLVDSKKGYNLTVGSNVNSHAYFECKQDIYGDEYIDSGGGIVKNDNGGSYNIYGKTMFMSTNRNAGRRESELKRFVWLMFVAKPRPMEKRVIKKCITNYLGFNTATNIITPSVELTEYDSGVPFATQQPIKIKALTGGTLPQGISDNTVYYVRMINTLKSRSISISLPFPITNYNIYDIRIRAVNINGNSAYSLIKSVGMKTLPTTPTLNISQTNLTSIDLTWTMTDDVGILYYIVEYKETTLNNWTTINTNNTDKLRTITGLDQNKYYDFRVKAVNLTGDSVYSDIKTVKTTALENSLPVIPNISSIINNLDTIDLTWTMTNDDFVLNYIIDYKIETATSWTSVTTPTNDKNFSITGLSPQTPYNIRIKTVNIFGESAYSNIIYTKTNSVSGSFPPTPNLNILSTTTVVSTSIIGGTPITSTRVTINLDWTVQSDIGIINYITEWKKSDDTVWSTSNNPSSTTQLTLHPTSTDAVNNTNIVDITTQGVGDMMLIQYLDIGDTDRWQFFIEWLTPDNGGGNTLSPRIDIPAPLSSGIFNVTSFVTTGDSSGNINSIGFNDLDQVVLWKTPDAILPEPLQINTPYWITKSPGSTSGVCRLHTSLINAQANVGIATNSINFTGIKFTTAGLGQVIFKYNDGKYAISYGHAKQGGGTSLVKMDRTVANFNSKDIIFMGIDFNPSTGSNPIAYLGINEPVSQVIPLNGNKGNTLAFLDEAPNTGLTPWTLFNSAQGHVSINMDFYSLVMGASSNVVLSEGEIRKLMNWFAYKYDLPNYTVEIPNLIPSTPVLTTLTSNLTTLNATWTTTNDEGIYDYIVEYKESSSGTWLVFFKTESPDKSIIITGLSQDTLYDVRVKSKNLDTSSPYSNTLTVRTKKLPVTPILDLPIVTSATIDLSWTVSSEDTITDYIVEYKRTVDTNWLVFNEGVTTDKFAVIDEGILDNTSYDTRVKAVNPFGVSPYSNVRTITTDTLGGGLPSRPTLTIATVDLTSLGLTWSVPNDVGITNYIIEIKESTSNIWTVIDTENANKSYTITTLSTGTLYNIRIKSQNINGVSLYSSTKSSYTLRYWVLSDTNTLMYLDMRNGITTVGGSAVSAWSDVLGNPLRTITQETNVNRPTLTASGVVFDGVNDIMSNDNPFLYASSNGFNFMMLASIPPNTSSSRRTITEASTTNTSTRYEIYCKDTTAGELGRMTQGLRNDSLGTRLIYGDNVSTESVFDSTFKLYEHIDTLTEIKLTINGVPKGTPISYTRSGQFTSNIFNIGGLKATGTAQNFSSFTVKAMIVLAANISNDDLQKAQGYIMWEFDMQDSLPNNHPYKNARPTKTI